MKLNKKKFIKAIILLLFILLLIIVLLIKLFNNKTSNSEEMKLNFKDRIETLEKFETDFIKFGWLQVQGTSIDLPILDFTSSETLQDYSFGWRSGRYSSDENREVLIGHNIINVSSTPVLSDKNLKNFEPLMSFIYAGFAKDNLYIKYTKNGKEELYLIYAVGFFNYGYDNAESFASKNKVASYIKDVRKNSIYDYDIDVNSSDSLLTIKTCTRYFGSEEKQQLFVDARKLRDGEKTIKYNVKTNKLFEKLFNNKEKN